MDDDIRDRLARAEQDIKNSKENFMSFKQDDFGALKREVHTMRDELNVKIDQLHEMLMKFSDRTDERAQEFREAFESKIHAINITMAKWLGAGAVVLVIVQVFLDKLVK